MSKKSEIKNIIKKYTADSHGGTLSSSKIMAGLGIGAVPAMIVDLFLTGGSISAITSTTYALLGLNGTVQSFALRDIYKQKERKNAAQQTIQSNELVFCTLEEMEKKLTKAFYKVAASPNDLSRKRGFIQTAEEVLTETKTISSTFKITNGGKYKFGKENYEFILNKAALERTKKEPLTLTETLKALSHDVAESDQELAQIKRKEEAKQRPRPKGSFGL